MKKIISILITLVLFISITSCGTRKVDKSRTQEAVQTDTSDNSIITKTEDVNLKVIEATKVDDKNETVISEETYEPINPLLPASITDENGKKIVLDNAKKTITETTQKNNTQTNNSKNTEQVAKVSATDTKDVKVNTNSKIAVEAIHIDRKAFNLWVFLWLLLLVPIYLVWKNKGAILDKIQSIWWL